MSVYVEHSSKVAFCPILFAANGGRFKEDGTPFIDGTPGLCDTPADCAFCPQMKNWLTSQVGAKVGWECPTCTFNSVKGGAVTPGFYHSSSSSPSIQCSNCGSSSTLLQLTLKE